MCQKTLKKCFTPAQDAQAVDHSSVRVCSHHAVRVDEAIAELDHSGQILQVHLVDCADLWRNHVHILKSFRTPLLDRHTRKEATVRKQVDL